MRIKTKFWLTNAHDSRHWQKGKPNIENALDRSEITKKTFIFTIHENICRCLCRSCSNRDVQCIRVIQQDRYYVRHNHISRYRINRKILSWWRVGSDPIYQYIRKNQKVWRCVNDCKECEWRLLGRLISVGYTSPQMPLKNVSNFVKYEQQNILTPMHLNTGIGVVAK